MNIEESFLELIDIDEIIFTDSYVNMVDLSVDEDESFLLENGIISHNSAKSMAISGMSVVGRDYYGAFPLKGKVLNIRNQPNSKIKDNEEIANIITILGLIPGKKYTDLSELRYGKVVLMTDADVDGIHIKGLLINLFHHFWPELLKMNFIYEFITPIVKATKGKEVKTFYQYREYNDWKKTNPTGYTIKYYKGLGTNSPAEAKDYFKNINKHLIPFKWNGEEANEKIDLVFNSKRAEDRKNWLLNYKGNTSFDKFGVGQTFEEFIDNEMIQFSMADNIRSIPSLFDGLKPSLRKILWMALKRNLKNEIKVSSFAGSIIENASYHHGNCLDYDTLINLADGTQVKIGDWATKFPEKRLLVKCVNEYSEPTIEIGHSARIGQTTNELYEIELEDGTIIKCTANHPFLVNGEWIEAKNLIENQDISEYK